MKNLSRDLKEVNPGATCFSETNLLYMKNFYLLYQRYMTITPQAGEQKENAITPQVGEQIHKDIFSIGWGHHKVLIDKYSKQPEKALFFVHQTIENGWSRDMLLNFMSTDLYERQGHALTNFKRTLPEETSDLVQELTKDPYDFAFTGKWCNSVLFFFFAARPVFSAFFLWLSRKKSVTFALVNLKDKLSNNEQGFNPNRQFY